MLACMMQAPPQINGHVTSSMTCQQAEILELTEETRQAQALIAERSFRGMTFIKRVVKLEWRDHVA